MINPRSPEVKEKVRPLRKLVRSIAQHTQQNDWLRLADYWEGSPDAIGIASEDYLFYFAKCGKKKWFVEVEDLKTSDEHSSGRVLFSGDLRTKAVLPFLDKWQQAPLPTQRIDLDDMETENWHALFEDWITQKAPSLISQEVKLEISDLLKGNKQLKLTYGSRSGVMQFVFSEKQVLIEHEGLHEESSITADPLGSFDDALLNMKYDYLELPDPSADIGTRFIRPEIAYFSTIQTPYNEMLMDELELQNIEDRIEHIYNTMRPVNDAEAEVLLDFLRSDLFSVWNTFYWVITSAPGWPFNEKLLLRFDPPNLPLVELQLSALASNGKVRTSPRLPTYSPNSNPSQFLREIKAPLQPAEAHLVLVTLFTFSKEADADAAEKAYAVIADSGISLDFVKAYGGSLLGEELLQLERVLLKRDKHAGRGGEE